MGGGTYLLEGGLWRCFAQALTLQRFPSLSVALMRHSQSLLSYQLFETGKGLHQFLFSCK